LRKVIFSDESNFEVQGLRVTHVRRSGGESVSPKHMQQTMKHALKRRSGAVFHTMAVVPWYLLVELMNSKKYIPIWATKMVPELKMLGTSGTPSFNKTLLHAIHQRK
jgi:hypothetical protein